MYFSSSSFISLFCFITFYKCNFKFFISSDIVLFFWQKSSHCLRISSLYYSTSLLLFSDPSVAFFTFSIILKNLLIMLFNSAYFSISDLWRLWVCFVSCRSFSCLCYKLRYSSTCDFIRSCCELKAYSNFSVNYSSFSICYSISVFNYS